MVSMPSRSSASAKAGSRAIRFCTSSLKSRVTAIARLLSPSRRLAPPLVIRPQLLRPFDVALLALLGAAREQDHQCLAVAPEINPVARSPVDPVFENSLPYPLRVRGVALLQPHKRDRHLGCGRCIKIGEPASKRAFPAGRKIVAHLSCGASTGCSDSVRGG